MYTVFKIDWLRCRPAANLASNLVLAHLSDSIGHKCIILYSILYLTWQPVIVYRGQVSYWSYYASACKYAPVLLYFGNIYKQIGVSQIKHGLSYDQLIVLLLLSLEFLI